VTHAAATHVAAPIAPEERVAFSAIDRRPRIAWPGGARVAVWVVPNVEHYEYLPAPQRVRDPWPRTPHPDVQGYGARDYGNRVGLWRLLDVLDRHPVRCTASLNLANFEHYPEIFEACQARRWDYMCHGIYNTQYLWSMPEDEERAYVQECANTFRRLFGRPLAGWYSPAMSHTVNTPDLIAAAGIKYWCDWVHDDQPFPFRVRSGRLITVPYSVDLNDAVMLRQGLDAEDFARTAIDAFDTLYREGASNGRVVCLAIHPYILGHPHRIRHLERVLRHIGGHAEVWHATGEEIADWYYANMWDRVVSHLGEGSAS
jgi:peptidoglycan/xylan/chitin deacetylase (PgdA/CDA1 family)